MNRKRVGQLILATVAAWGFAAQAARAADITFWSWRPEDRAAYAELFGEFTKQNPDIHVTFQPYPPENYNTIVSTALAGGKGPDALQTRAYGGLEQLAQAGYLMPLDPKTVPELANLPPAALASETLRSDGKVYAISFATQTLGILVNKDIFASAGVKEPATWAEFLDACKTLKAKGLIPIANGTATAWMDEVFTSIFTNPFLGPQFVSDILSGKATFEDPRYTGALAKLLELRDYMPPGFSGIDYATGQQLFLSGRAAMFIGGSFEIANFRKQNPKINLDFFAPPAPKAGDPRYVTTYADGGYGVNAKSEHQADALKLVSWMGTKQFGDKFAALLGNISPIKGVVITDPLLSKVQQLDQTAMPYIMLSYFRLNSPTGSELLQGGIQKMMAGNETPEQVGKDITQGIAHYYKPFQK